MPTCHTPITDHRSRIIAGDALNALRSRGFPQEADRLGGGGKNARRGGSGEGRDRLGPASRFPRGPSEESVRKGRAAPYGGCQRVMRRRSRIPTAAKNPMRSAE